MIPNMKKLIFLGDGIYPNPEYNKQLKNIIARDFPYLQYQFISSYNYTLPELYNALRNADKETGVLVSTWFAETLTSQQMLINAYRSLSSISSPCSLSAMPVWMTEAWWADICIMKRYLSMNCSGMSHKYLMESRQGKFLSLFLQMLIPHLIIRRWSIKDSTLNYALKTAYFMISRKNFLKKYIWGYHRNIHHTFADSPYPTKTHTNVERTKKGSKARIRNQIKYTNLIDNMPILYMKEKVIRNENGNIVETIFVTLTVSLKLVSGKRKYNREKGPSYFLNP